MYKSGFIELLRGFFFLVVRHWLEQFEQLYWTPKGIRIPFLWRICNSWARELCSICVFVCVPETWRRLDIKSNPFCRLPRGLENTMVPWPTFISSWIRNQMMLEGLPPAIFWYYIATSTKLHAKHAENFGQGWDDLMIHGRTQLFFWIEGQALIFRTRKISVLLMWVICSDHDCMIRMLLFIYCNVHHYFTTIYAKLNF